MPIATNMTSQCSESGSRPGLTSLIKTGRGLLTVQTEILGDPARLVTIVDLRGRVLKTWQSSFLVAAGNVDAARGWHQGVEREVREGLARLAKRTSSESSRVGACLFVEGITAYAAGDYQRARALLEGCERLLPNDGRVAAALARVRAVETHARETTSRLSWTRSSEFEGLEQ